MRAGRKKHVALIPLVIRDPSVIKTRSDQLTQVITLGLLNVDQYTKDLDRRVAVYRQAFAKGKGQISLVLAPGSGEGWEDVLTSLQTLGDELVDTFLAFLAVAIDTYGAEGLTQPLTLHADDLLAVCQKKRTHGSYTAGQRTRVMEHLRTLSRIQVHATLALRGDRRVHVEGTILDMLDDHRSMDAQRIGGDYQHPQRLQLGNWVMVIPQWRHQIALMARRVLGYHAKTHKYEKRLGRYLTLLFRINAHRHGGRARISMEVLLEQAGIVPKHQHPGRMRDQIEGALLQLRQDEVIGTYAPLLEGGPRSREIQERIEQHAYHWWDDYRTQRWLFEPPEWLRQAYQSIHREANIPE